jgi:hypothetical protein
LGMCSALNMLSRWDGGILVIVMCGEFVENGFGDVY